MTAQHFLASAMDHHRHGRLPAAEAAYRQALVLAPRNADALHLLGTILAQRGETEEGIALIQRALTAAPTSFEAHFNLANIFARLSRFADAERHFRAARRLRPSHAEAANGLGGALLRLGRMADAEVALKAALKIDPKLPTALVNMATVSESTGRFDQTLSYYDRVLATHPQHTEAHQYKALALLLRGRLAEGWREYVWRFKRTPAFHGRLPFPLWQGEPLAGRKILVWTEQGLGEEIITAGMLPDLLAAGAHVVVLCSPRIRALLAQSFPTINFIAWGGQADHPAVTADIAFQASMSDLGQQLRPALDAFPPAAAYLMPNTAQVETLHQKYRSWAGAKRVVGISWRSRSQDGEAEKTVPLEYWGPILTAPDLHFVSLQYGESREDIDDAAQRFGVKISVDPDIDPMGDLAPFAAQVAAMDLVISVSNTTVHVAGALGVPVWALIPNNTGRLWYWFLERADSPWYPRLRLYRQRGPGWQETMTDIESALAQPENT